MHEASSPGVDQRFPKCHRLLARKDFLRARARGRKVHTQHLIALWMPSAVGQRRVGLTVSTKVGNAVVRNQVKRWLREIYRRERERLPPRMDLVLIAKAGAMDAGYHALHAQFLEIARRLGG
jgi:ribonuclease P protein component